MSRPPNVVRLADLPWEDAASPSPYGGSARELAGVLPLRDLGAHVDALPPGAWSCPLHDHLLEEEVFYVLEGEIVVHERTPEGRRVEYALRAGELVCYPPGTRLAHAFRNDGAVPAQILCLSDRRPGDVCTYPDSGKTLLRGGNGLGVWHGRPPGTPSPGEAPTNAKVHEVAAARARREKVRRLAPAARPGHVVTGYERLLGDGDRELYGASLSRSAGATAVFVNRDRLPAGHHPSPLHAHLHEEELLLVLSGALTLTQRARDGVVTTCELGPGDLVHWAPGGPAHRIDNPGPDDAVYLVVGTDRAWDVVDFPDAGERYVRLLGEIGELSPAEYWDGEVPAPRA